MKNIFALLAVAGAMATGTAANAVVTIQQDLVFSSAVPGANAQSLALYDVAGSTLTSVFIEWLPKISAIGTVTLTSGSNNNRTLFGNLTLQSALSSSAFSLATGMTGTTGNISFVRSSVQSGTVSAVVEGMNSLTPVDVAPFVGSGSILVTNTFQNLVLSGLTTITGGGGNVSLSNVNLNAGGVLRVTYEGTDAVVGMVPEPGTWLMMVVGFGLVGIGIRRQPATRVSTTA